MKRNRIPAAGIAALLLLCLAGCGVQTGEQTEKANDFDISVNESYHSNPIDRWRNEMTENNEMTEEYGLDWEVAISYEYKEAWKAEFEHRVQMIEAKEQAAAYLEAVEQEVEAITNLWKWHVLERDGGTGWARGDSTALNESVAQVYKNAVFQWDYSTNYFFDPEAATENLQDWFY